MVEITANDQNKLMQKMEDTLRDIWGNTKCIKIPIIVVPEEDERKKGYGKFLKRLELKFYSIRKRK